MTHFWECDCLAEQMWRENTGDQHLIHMTGRCHFCGNTNEVVLERQEQDHG